MRQDNREHCEQITLRCKDGGCTGFAEKRVEGVGFINGAFGQIQTNDGDTQQRYHSTQLRDMPDQFAETRCCHFRENKRCRSVFNDSAQFGKRLDENRLFGKQAALCPIHCSGGFIPSYSAQEPFRPRATQDGIGVFPKHESARHIG